ncbi:MAG TPA: DoxX family protein [Vicinamibacterales bacterium]
MSSPVPSRLTPHLLSALRIVAACLFVVHGTQKTFGFPGHVFHLPPLPLTLFATAGYLEVAGGVLMLLGWQTRPVAFVLAGEMAVAYFTQHLPRGRWPINNGGELAILFCFVWLLICAAGPGPWSVDSFHRGR